MQKQNHIYSSDTRDEISNRSKNPNLVRLVEAYRTYGHLKASLDPLNLQATK